MSIKPGDTGNAGNENDGGDLGSAAGRDRFFSQGHSVAPNPKSSAQAPRPGPWDVPDFFFVFNIFK